jgi:hypothetical protein
MKDWLEQNPDGSKDAFDRHFKVLSQEDRKVCDTALQTLTDDSSFTNHSSIQKYKTLALEAVCTSITYACCAHLADSMISKERPERIKLKV